MEDQNTLYLGGKTRPKITFLLRNLRVVALFKNCKICKAYLNVILTVFVTMMQARHHLHQLSLFNSRMSFLFSGQGKKIRNAIHVPLILQAMYILFIIWYSRERYGPKTYKKLCALAFKHILVFFIFRLRFFLMKIARRKRNKIMRYFSLLLFVQTYLHVFMHVFMT